MQQPRAPIEPSEAPLAQEPPFSVAPVDVSACVQVLVAGIFLTWTFMCRRVRW